MAKKSGSEMFSDLTHDETWLLSSKLISGSAMASRVIHDHDLTMEIHDVTADVQANFEPSRNRK
jgi:hypothetical protein